MTASLRLALTIAALALATLLLWITYGYASAYRLYGSAAIATTFRVATALAAGGLFVLIAVRLVFQPAYVWIAQQPPTHLQLGVAIALATLIAAASSLAWFGVDLSTILTTSALVTAIVGLSVQPLLASLMSGLALQRTVRIGDGVVIGGRPVSVTSLDWRSVVAQRADGSSLIIPNSKLAADTLEVLPRDRPVLTSITLEMPADVAPHRIRDVVTRVAAGIASIDVHQPVTISPQSCRFGASTVAQVVTFWVTRFESVEQVESTMLRRCWYALRRDGLSGATSPADTVAAKTIAPGALREALSSDDVELATLPDDFTDRAIADGVHLEFDDGEQIIVPAHLQGDLCVLAAGRIEMAGPGHAEAIDDKAPKSTPASIERALAQRIGPYASICVREALRGGASIVALCYAAADEIDDADRRAAFLVEVLPPARPTRAPGCIFRAGALTTRERAFELAPRAVGYAHVIVVGAFPNA